MQIGLGENWSERKAGLDQALRLPFTHQIGIVVSIGCATMFSWNKVLTAHFCSDNVHVTWIYEWDNKVFSLLCKTRVSVVTESYCEHQVMKRSSYSQSYNSCANVLSVWSIDKTIRACFLVSKQKSYFFIPFKYNALLLIFVCVINGIVYCHACSTTTS